MLMHQLLYKYGIFLGVFTATLCNPLVTANSAEAWLGVLKLDTVGIHVTFFDLGGNSLKIMEMSGKLSRALGREIPVAKLFEHTTIASLAIPAPTLASAFGQSAIFATLIPHDTIDFGSG